jgi:hypothetical protein
MEMSAACVLNSDEGEAMKLRRGKGRIGRKF